MATIYDIKRLTDELAKLRESSSIQFGEGRCASILLDTDVGEDVMFTIEDDQYSINYTVEQAEQLLAWLKLWLGDDGKTPGVADKVLGRAIRVNKKAAD